MVPLLTEEKLLPILFLPARKKDTKRKRERERTQALDGRGDTEL